MARIPKAMKQTYIRNILTAMTILVAPYGWAQEAEPARAQESGVEEVAPVTAAESATAEADKAAAKDGEQQPQKYDLTALPADLRQKVEAYLKEQAELEKEIERLDSMMKASSNAWAQQRATGMATKLNYELKNMRLKRREIIRDYRDLLRSGWEPPASMDDFESLFFAPRGESNS